MRHKPIHLHIPTPCHENWQEMTPYEQGRFCSSCQKTVTDFTTWSDRALFEFFSKNEGAVCGRFMNCQLSRDIQIPYQPKSRLYRIAIACGLTLMFTQVPEAHSRVRPSMEILSGYESENTEGDEEGVIEGRVRNKRGRPIVNAMIEVYQDGNKKATAYSSNTGWYNVKALPAGNYDVVFSYAEYGKITFRQVIVSPKRPVGIFTSFDKRPGVDREVIYQQPYALRHESPQMGIIERGRGVEMGERLEAERAADSVNRKK